MVFFWSLRHSMPIVFQIGISSYTFITKHLGCLNSGSIMNGIMPFYAKPAPSNCSRPHGMLSDFWVRERGSVSISISILPISKSSVQLCLTVTATYKRPTYKSYPERGFIYRWPFRKLLNAPGINHTLAHFMLHMISHFCQVAIGGLWSGVGLQLSCKEQMIIWVEIVCWAIRHCKELPSDKQIMHFMNENIYIFVL